MPFKASMANNIERSRTAVWLLIVIILVLSFMLAWESVEEEAGDTAFVVASKRVLERANYYKQEWLLKSQPSELVLEKKRLIYDTSGWVLPINESGEVSCRYWLKVLYPDMRVLDVKPRAYYEQDLDNGYACAYPFSMHQSIVIRLVDGRFSVSVDFSSQ